MSPCPCQSQHNPREVHTVNVPDIVRMVLILALLGAIVYYGSRIAGRVAANV